MATQHRRSAPAMPRVAVAGGSIGGLTAAILLLDLGCDVTVYERSGAELQSRGAGIVAHPAAVRYLVERSIAGLDDITVASQRLRYVDASGRDDFVMHVCYRFTAWNTLYRSLRGCLDPGRCRLGEALVAFEQDARGVDLHLESGRRERCDLLLCVDGVASTGRSLMLPDSQPAYAGYVAWRGTVPESIVSSATLAELVEDIVYQVMPSSHFLVYPIPSIAGSVDPGHRLLNFVWYRNVAAAEELDELLTDVSGVRRDSLPPGAVRPPYLDELHEAARKLAPPLREVVELCPEPFIQPIVDLEVPRMAFGRVCLMGDAAFVARPHAAAGTAKACADGWALAEALASAGGDVVAALPAWEQGQLALGRQLVERARQVGNRLQFWGSYRPEDPTNRFGLWGPGN